MEQTVPENYQQQEQYIFTFGWNTPGQGYCVRIPGTYAEAREKMIAEFGIKWAFQYDYLDWIKLWDKREPLYPKEQEVSIEEAHKIINENRRRFENGKETGY